VRNAVKSFGKVEEDYVCMSNEWNASVYERRSWESDKPKLGLWYFGV